MLGDNKGDFIMWEKIHDFCLEKCGPQMNKSAPSST